MAPADDPTSEPAASAMETGGARAAVLPLTITGELSEADQAALAARLVEGLERGSFAVVSPEQVASMSSDAAACADAKCFTAVANASSASHLVQTSVTIEDRDYQVSVTLIDGTDGVVLARTDDGCEICGVADVGGLLATAAATLRTKLDALASGPATLLLTSDPIDADVYIDGELVGVTPLDRPVLPGKHLLRISKDGYIALEREVTFVEGVRETIDTNLDKVPSRLPGRRWGWVSIGVGAVALGGGLALTFLHDKAYESDCTGDNIDPAGNCKFLWDTKWAGAGTAIAGAALGTLGVAILLTTSKRKTMKLEDDKFEARVGLGPGNISLQGSF